MEQLGLKNFRRFADFQQLEFSNINFFVGCNNSGKSTIVKAILLLFANLVKLQRFNRTLGKFEFDFAPLDYHRALHIGSFDRAVNVEHQEDPIVFEIDLGTNFLLTIEIEKNKQKDLSTAPIKRIVIKDKRNHSKYEIDYVNRNVHFDMSNKIGQDNDKIIESTVIKKVIENISNNGVVRDILKSSIDSENLLGSEAEKEKKEFDSLMELIKTKTDDMRAMLKKIRASEKNIVKDISFNQLPVPLIFADEPYTRRENYNGSSEMNGEITMDLEYQFIEYQKKYFEDMSRELNTIPSIEYIYAHAISQDTFYKINDRDDYMAQTIQSIYNLKLEDNSEEKKFIIRWMKIFEIGSDYQIKTIDGNEGYFVKITNEFGKEMNMAEKGVGSIQLMILLFKIAFLIRKYYRGKSLRGKRNPLILVEEPEQNLHPSVQAKLTDLFFEINKKYQMRFIVETHSEYIIRRTQAIIAESVFDNVDDFKNKNPFKVFYFPNSGCVYDMEMTSTGRFNNVFDEGFFDVAAKLNMKVFSAERRKNNV